MAALMWNIVSTTSAVGLTVLCISISLVHTSPLYSHRSSTTLAKCFVFQLKLVSKCNVSWHFDWRLVVYSEFEVDEPMLYVPIQSTELLPFLFSCLSKGDNQARQKKNFFSITQFPLRVSLSLSLFLPHPHTQEGASQQVARGHTSNFILLFLFAPNTYAIGREEF